MAISIFGLEIGKAKKEAPQVVHDKTTDGATEIVDYGGVYFDGFEDIIKAIETERELILHYRCVANVPEVDQAIGEIVNDTIVYPKSESYPVKINMDSIEITDNIKDKISQCFEEVLEKLKFDKKADDLFRDWYIDGRLPIYIHVDGNRTSKGISKLIHMDPLQVRKIREIKKGQDKDQVEKVLGIEEYYIYDPNKDMPTEFANMSLDKYSVSGRTSKGIKLTKDSVVYSTSEIMDEERKYIISYLHKAIKPSNNLSQIEDAMVIYRLSRAPERRVFYVDVGNLPKTKAEQYLASLMNKFRNKLSYNSVTGKVKNETHQKSILEDIWLPRREGGKGTEIDVLGGGDGFSGITEEVNYFKQKLYKALNVPVGRIDSENTFVFGQDGEITRDEIKFAKFVTNLRNTFAHSLFDQLLKTQLVLKKVMNLQEFEQIAGDIVYMWEDDSHFAELKELEVTSKRVEALEMIDGFVNTYYSQEWVKRHILFQTDEDIEEIKKQIDKEQKEREAEEEDGTAQDGQGDQGEPAGGGQQFKITPVAGDQEEQ